jgi:molybdenum cofactor biosynthesis protein MoaC
MKIKPLFGKKINNMVNINDKSNSLRKAIASAVVKVSKTETIHAVQNGLVPKGDVFSFAKVAALFAIKKTSDIIPDCHPLPVEFADIHFSVHDLSIEILVEVHTIYKTGVEVEAMHGASVAALTLYDMLKPIDKQVEIHQIRLVSKEGGKTDFKLNGQQVITASVIVCSDSVHQKLAEDKAGIALIEKLKGLSIATTHYLIIPDNKESIEAQVQLCTKTSNHVLIFVGGTGVSPRDITPETIQPLLEKELIGVMDQARNYGQERMPYAMLSRSVAGTIGETLVLSFPGSTKAAIEYFNALFPQVLHSLNMLKGEKH